MKKYPKLSIVTPSFNCGEYIEETILSVLNQNYDNFEYFVIDGSSTDKTIEILKKYAKKFPNNFGWISEQDNGQTDAINKGLKMCSGDWFAWINADDFYEPNIFSKIAKHIKLNPKAGVIYGNCFDIKDNQKIRLNIPRKKINFETQKSGNKIFGPASFFNIKAIKKIGNFNDSLHYWMDYEMYVRISKIMSLKYFNLNIANFRIRHGQKSKTKKYENRMKKEGFKIMRQYYPLFYIYNSTISKPLKIAQKILKRIPLLQKCYQHLKQYPKRKKFKKEFHQFKNLSGIDNRFSILWKDKYRCLNDKTSQTPFDAHYIYHPAWAARILGETKPTKHIDISSTLHFCSLISAFIPVEFYDFRPAKLNLNNLISKKADITALPFENESVESLSCMHTIEHIGLGRYGDKLDPEGDLKAIKELKRVLAPNGDLLFVVPVGKPKIMFNAHRIYSYKQIMEYFSGFELKDFSLVTDEGEFIQSSNEETADKQNYGCGCFWFKKR